MEREGQVRVEQPTADEKLTIPELRQALAQAQSRVAELTVLREITLDLSRHLDNANLVLRRITGAAAETLQAEASSLLLVDEETGELVFSRIYKGSGQKLQRERLAPDEGIAGWVATHGEPLIVNDVERDPRFTPRIDEETGFQTQSILCAPLWARGRVIGVLEVLNRRDGQPFDEENLRLLRAFCASAAVAMDNARLYRAVYQGYMDTMSALAATIDAKDPYTRGHSVRVTRYSLQIARQLNLPTRNLDTVMYAAVLHDIGKIGIDEAILRKPGLLTPKEAQVMALHPVIGGKIVERVAFLREAQACIRHHHERYDGSGYPDGLLGEAIPLGARIIAVADAFDAMTTDRPYRAALSQVEALAELQRDTGRHLDPTLVRLFVEHIDELTVPELSSTDARAEE